MQFEELQQQWQRLDQKMDRSLALATELARQVVVQPARRRIQRLAVWPAIDVALCVVVLLFLGTSLFGGGERDVRFVGPASVVAAGCIALLVDSFRQLACIAALDWTGAVTLIQSALERLRVAKIRQFKWLILFAPLVGFCGLLVGVSWLSVWLTGDRFNALDRIDSGWIVANCVFGVLFVPAGYFLARVLARRCHRHPWWQSVLDDISGNSLKVAAEDVERWARFQHGEQHDSD